MSQYPLLFVDSIIQEYFKDTAPCISKFCSDIRGWGRSLEIELLRFYQKCPCPLEVYSTELLSRRTPTHPPPPPHTHTVFNEFRGCFTLLRAFSETKQKARGMGNNSHCTIVYIQYIIILVRIDTPEHPKISQYCPSATGTYRH